MPNEPDRLAHRRDIGERRIRRPARLRGAARHEEAGEHDDAAEEVHPVAHHVELGERHVGRADLQRHHEVAEAADRERHDAEKHHDRAVHRAELVVELRQHDAARRLVRAEPVADHRNRMAGIGQLKPHQHHQAEAEQQKQEAGDRVLHADHLVVQGEHVLAPEAQLLVTRARARARGRGPSRLLSSPTSDSFLQWCGMDADPNAKRAIVCRRYKRAQAPDSPFGSWKIPVRKALERVAVASHLGRSSRYWPL